MNLQQLLVETEKTRQVIALTKQLINILEQHLPDDTGTRLLPQLVSPESGVIPDDVLFDHIDRLNKELEIVEYDLVQYNNLEVQPSKGAKKAAKVRVSAKSNNAIKVEEGK